MSIQKTFAHILSRSDGRPSAGTHLVVEDDLLAEGTADLLMTSCGSCCALSLLKPVGIAVASDSVSKVAVEADHSLSNGPAAQQAALSTRSTSGPSTLPSPPPHTSPHRFP